MPLDLSPIKQAIRERTLFAMEQLGNNSVENLKEALSTPYPPSGPTPSGPPAKRTGALQEGVAMDVSEPDEATIRLTVESTRVTDTGDPEEVPEWLEWGTDKMGPRPYMRPELDRIEGEGLNIVAETLQ